MTRILLIAVLVAGCTSTPQATPERDADAKRFDSRHDAATIYVYRDEFATSPSDDTVLYVDDRLIGSTLPKTFFRFDVRAGTRLLHGYGYDQGTLKIDARDGEIYFISLKTTGGTSDFRLVAPETGKRDILRCCALLENWAPDQRPLLR
ncbi:MAG TPA: DUF2846 domain-containing protein [Burkholderiales bacterium]|nr:DUF2846 domain-containing protein [Burkholderiales bacterium]